MMPQNKLSSHDVSREHFGNDTKTGKLTTEPDSGGFPKQDWSSRNPSCKTLSRERNRNKRIVIETEEILDISERDDVVHVINNEDSQCVIHTEASRNVSDWITPDELSGSESSGASMHWEDDFYDGYNNSNDYLSKDNTDCIPLESHRNHYRQRCDEMDGRGLHVKNKNPETSSRKIIRGKDNSNPGHSLGHLPISYNFQNSSEDKGKLDPKTTRPYTAPENPGFTFGCYETGSQRQNITSEKRGHVTRRVSPYSKNKFRDRRRRHIMDDMSDYQDEVSGDEVDGFGEGDMKKHLLGQQANKENASDMWSMMMKTSPGIATCNICHHTFKYGKGKSNMLRHVKTHMTEKTMQAETTTEGERCPSTTTSHVRLVQPTLKTTKDRVTKYRPESEKKKILDDKLLRLICQHLQPFSIVEDTGFREFVKELNKRYELPSRRQLFRALPKKYEAEKEHLKNTLREVAQLAITTDAWTSLQSKSYLTLTAHFIEPLPSWTPRSVVLATRPVADHSAAGTSIVLKEIFEEYEIVGKISSAVTENASAMVVKEHLEIHHVRCFAQDLNLIVKDSLNNSQGVIPIIERVKAIVKYFYHSPKATEVLRFIQNGLKTEQRALIQSVDTRWNSVLQMLRRYLEEHRAVSGALVALDKSDLIIPDGCIEKIQQICQALEPFEQAAVEISSEQKTSLSKVLPIVLQVLKYLKNEPKSSLRDSLLANTNRRFPDLEENFTQSAATLIDPRFKRLPFSNEQLLRKHEDQLCSMLRPLFSSAQPKSGKQEEAATGITSPPKKKSIWDTFDNKVKESDKAAPQTLTGPMTEMKRYFEMKYLKRTGDPLKWWEENYSLLPKLSILARQFLHIPATSVPPERLFSKAGELVSARKSCFEGSTIDMVLFLNNQML